VALEKRLRNHQTLDEETRWPYDIKAEKSGDKWVIEVKSQVTRGEPKGYLLEEGLP